MYVWSSWFKISKCLLSRLFQIFAFWSHLNVFLWSLNIFAAWTVASSLVESRTEEIRPSQREVGAQADFQLPCRVQFILETSLSASSHDLIWTGTTVWLPSHSRTFLFRTLRPGQPDRFGVFGVFGVARLPHTNTATSSATSPTTWRPQPQRRCRLHQTRRSTQYWYWHTRQHRTSQSTGPQSASQKLLIHTTVAIWQKAINQSINQHYQVNGKNKSIN